MLIQVSETDSVIDYTYTQNSLKSFYRGQKRYELSNHLGNVLAVITDRRIQACGAGDVMQNEAQVVSVSDYYPFGMGIKEREWKDSSFGYRFGFNGKEGDNEVSGNGNSYDYGFRIYNPRLGKFLSVDPLSSTYPWNSTYAFAENTPLAFIDLEGAEKYLATTSPEIDKTGNGTGRTLVHIHLSTTETIAEQQKGGMATVSWNGGDFNNDFKYQFIQDLLGESFFYKENLYMKGSTPLVDRQLNSGSNLIKGSGYSAAASPESDAPQYFTHTFVVPSTDRVTKSSVTTSVEKFAAAAGTGTGMAGGFGMASYSAGVSVAGSLNYSLGSEDHPDWTWDITVTDESGNEIWSDLNATTEGKDVNIDLSSMISTGNHTLTVTVQQSAGSITPPRTDDSTTGGGASTGSGWNFKLDVDAENVD